MLCPARYCRRSILFISDIQLSLLCYVGMFQDKALLSVVALCHFRHHGLWCDAGRLIQELQTKATASTAPQSLGAGDAAKLHHLLRSAHFAKPDGKHLSPAGEYNLRLGVIKELHPDLIATHQGDSPH